MTTLQYYIYIILGLATITGLLSSGHELFALGALITFLMVLLSEDK